MKLSEIVLAAIVTTLTIAALVIGTAWSLWPRAAQASLALTQSHATSAEAGLAAGRRGPHCGRLDAAHLELAEAVVEATLDLDAAQAAALAEIGDGLEGLRAFVESACENHDHGDVAGSLTAMEQILNRSAETMTLLKPQLVAFHESLTEDQHARIQTLMALRHRHGGRSGGWHGRH